MKKGLTLIEIVISLGLLGFVIGILFFFLNWKVREAVRERSIAFMQADIAITRQLLEWDIWMAGYGLESSVSPIAISGGGYNSSDTLKLRSIAFITQTGRWSFTIDDVTNSDKLVINKWDNASENLHAGDTVVIMRSNKTLVAGPVTILLAKDTSYTTQGGVTRTGLLIQLSQNIDKLNSGSLVFEANGSGGTYREVVYALGSDETLRRSGEEVLQNVVAFWVDVGMDTTSELQGNITWFDDINASWTPDYIRARLKGVQIGIIVHSSSKDKDYTFPDEEITIETPDGQVQHTYQIPENGMHYHWNTVIILAKPRNLLR